MKRITGAWVLVLIIVIVGYFSMNPHIAPMREDFDVNRLMSVLSGLFIIVLLVERITELFVSVWRNSETQLLKFEVKRSSENAEFNIATEKQFELKQYQTETQRFAMYIGYMVSVIVCAAGVGVLSQVLQAPPNDYFLRGVDIVLTAGLIAGGSDGLHQFVRTIGTFLSKTKEKLNDE